MTKEKLVELLSGDYEAAVKALSVRAPLKTELPLDEYDVTKHDVFNTSKRPDIPRKDKDGNEISPRKVNRIGVAFQQVIAERAAAFLCANPIQYQATPLTPAEEKVWAAFKVVNEATKLDYKNQGILEKRMSEMEAAEIWYLEDVDPEGDDYWAGLDGYEAMKQKPRLFISALSLNDKLYPLWDGQDNLIGFGRGYVLRNDEDKDVEHFDVYTAERIYEGMKGENGWESTPKPNEIGKIPVVFHSQENVEWAKVKTEIARLENLVSNLADSNDKVVSPILFVQGDIKKLPDGTTGRVIQGGKDTNLSYVTSDNAPESLKFEVLTLEKYIFSMTDTPDISLDNLKGIGSTSGFAIKLMFMGAHLKASKHAATFGEAIQRRINLIKKMLLVIDPSIAEGFTLKIKPKFDVFLPKDVAGIVDFLSTAVGTKLLSLETAVSMLQESFGGDAVKEFERVTAEKNADGALSDVDV